MSEMSSTEYDAFQTNYIFRFVTRAMILFYDRIKNYLPVYDATFTFQDIGKLIEVTVYIYSAAI